jgi:hypothetical protein
MLTPAIEMPPDARAAYLSHRPVVIDVTRPFAGGGRHNAFAQYRFSNADIANLPRIIGKDLAVLAELLPVIEALNRHSAGSFKNVSQLYASLPCRAAPRPSMRALAALQTLFLDAVDRRLQSLYRRYLAAHPPPPDARHDDKMALLESLHAQTQDIVSDYDWQWLADWLERDRIETTASCLRRLSNFAFKLRCVNFRFTYHCNISCRHCYNSSGPHLKNKKIALDPMLAIVARMPSVGIGRLNLTGGEPFLYPEQLVALIEAGRAAGLNGITINTNGFWAATDDKATRTLQRLAAAGFMRGPGDYLKVSGGSYHREFLPFDRVMIAAGRYHAMFARPLKVDYEVAPEDHEATKRVRDQVLSAGLSDRIELLFRRVRPLGRGRELQGFSLGQIDQPCTNINQIVFDPDGSARPCCGLNNANSGIVVGSLHADGLRDLVKRMQNDPVLQFLNRNPMDAIFRYLDRPQNPEGYSGVCDLCQDALGQLADKEALQARLFSRQNYYPFWFTVERSSASGPREPDKPTSLDLD